MSHRERQALLLLLALTATGHVFRLAFQGSDSAAGGVTLLSAFPGDDLGRQRLRSQELSRPLAPGERVDLNRASIEDLTRLPGIGPALAGRVVAARVADGPFGSMEDVDRVPGVGPAVMRTLDSLATLGDTTRARVRRAVSRAAPPPAPGPVPGATIRLRDLPVIDEGPTGPGVPSRPSRVVNLNRATLADLVGLPGIGPAKAKAILAYRQSHGPFASVGDLQKVPGVGPVLLRQLAPQVTVR